jgi:hypothetical protein
MEVRMFKWIAAGIGALVIMLSLAFGLEWLGIGWAGYFGPKHENVRRQVFEATQSYNRGVTQDLSKAYREYLAAPDSNKAAIRAVLKVQFAEYNDEKLDPVLRNFLTEIRGY